MMSLSARVIVWVAVCVLVACGETKVRREPESERVPPGDEPRDAQVPFDASQGGTSGTSGSGDVGGAAGHSPPLSDAGDSPRHDAAASDPPVIDAMVSDNGDDASTSEPEPDDDAGTPEPPDLSCGAFAGATAGLATCGSLQAWQPPALPYEGFAINRADWLPIDGDDGYLALVTVKRDATLVADGWLSMYRFDEQGTCLEHLGTIENVLPFYPIYLHKVASRGGTVAVAIAATTRVGTLGQIIYLANGKRFTSVQGESRMDVTPAGEIVIAQTPWHEDTGAYGLVLRVFDAQGTLLREAEPASPGLVAEIDASTPGELAVMYRTPGSPGDWTEAERRIDRYGADELSLLGSWRAPEGVTLEAFDVEGARVAVAGHLSGTTTWTQVLELPGWTAAWSQGAEASGLEDLVDLDLTTDGRVLVVGNTYSTDSFDWLLGYRLDGSTLWSAPQTQAPGYGFRAVSGQQNGHVLMSGARGYCDPP